VLTADGLADGPVMCDPGSTPWKAETTPTMARTSMSDPMSHIQIGILALGVDGVDGATALGRLAGRPRLVSTDSTGGGVLTGLRLAVHARPFQYRVKPGSFWSGYQPGSRASPGTISPSAMAPLPQDSTPAHHDAGHGGARTADRPGAG
jgi:hypothetical protein